MTSSAACARPVRRAAHADEDAFDAALLARVREQPIAARRTVPRAVAVPVAAGVTVTATAVVMLGGGPGDVGGPSSASAITQALHWLNPPPGTILHVRSVETLGGADHHARVLAVGGPPRLRAPARRGRAGLRDRGQRALRPGHRHDLRRAARRRGRRRPTSKAGAEKRRAGTPASGKPGDGLPAGDPIVDKVRILLQEGQMVVSGREIHNGTEAWAISLKPDVGRPVWTLWVSAADGKPLELRDPGRDASEQPQVIRWPTYEVLPGSRRGPRC